MADGHALGLARRARGEDDPRGVLRPRLLEAGGVSIERGARLSRPTFSQHAETFVGEHTVDVGLAEDHLGALVGIVGVDRHISSSGGQGGKNGEVELALAGGHADADAVAAAHAVSVELGGPCGDVGKQLGIGENLTIVEGRSIRVLLCSCAHDVPQGALRRG